MSSDTNKLVDLIVDMLKPDCEETCGACACTVKEFFEAANDSVVHNITIPDYQRGYAWKDEQLNQLFQDLRLSKEKEKEAYHLGTIILHLNRKENRLDVVDGQQRLRTFDLLLNGGVTKLTFGDEKQNDEFAYARTLCKDVAEELREPLQNGTLVCLIVTKVDEAFQLFETQNARGKPLSMENLLKAYHYHEMTHGGLSQLSSNEEKRLFTLERQWEKDVVDNQWNEEVGDFCSVLSKHLLLIRRWSRGAEKPFFSLGENSERVPHLNEYKGDKLVSGGAPWQNSWVVCQEMRKWLRESLLLKNSVAPRLTVEGKQEVEGLDPFVSICQSIINGESFFEYAQTFARMASVLFDFDNADTGDVALNEFRCNSKALCGQVNNLGGTRSKTVYEAFILLAADRFGCKGVYKLYLDLWLLAYYDRLTETRVVYTRAGQKFGQKVCALLSSYASLEFVSAELRKYVKDATGEIAAEQEKGQKGPEGRTKKTWESLSALYAEWNTLYAEWNKRRSSKVD